MPVRKIFGLVLVIALVLTLGTAWGGTSGASGVSGSASKTVKVGPNKLEVAGQFLFDPIVRSGKFIAGEFSCVALGVNTKTITITKCYLVLSNGATYAAKVKTHPTLAKVYRVLQNTPAINITQCITVTATFKNNSATSVHLASAPQGQPVLPCKLG